MLGLISIFISFGSLLLVLLQWHGHIKQRRLESMIHVYDVNRQLISQGFDQPELFKILEDEPDTDPALTRRYLQLWLNQLALIHRIHTHGLFKREVQSSLVRDIKDFMAMSNMRRHWRLYGKYYPDSFRHFVKNVIREIEADSDLQKELPLE